jgi:hypothetical protein
MLVAMASGVEGMNKSLLKVLFPTMGVALRYILVDRDHTECHFYPYPWLSIDLDT